MTRQGPFNIMGAKAEHVTSSLFYCLITNYELITKLRNNVGSPEPVWFQKTGDINSRNKKKTMEGVMTYSSEELRSQEEVDYLSFNDPRGYTHRYNNKRIADTSNNHQDSIESQE